MEKGRSGRVWTIAGALALAATMGVLVHRSAPKAPEDMRDAVAAPVSPAALGGARVIAPDQGWFAGPAGRRAEAERAMMATRAVKSSKSARARAERLRRQAARERALAVSAQ